MGPEDLSLFSFDFNRNATSNFNTRVVVNIVTKLQNTSSLIHTLVRCIIKVVGRAFIKVDYFPSFFFDPNRTMTTVDSPKKHHISSSIQLPMNNSIFTQCY